MPADPTLLSMVHGVGQRRLRSTTHPTADIDPIAVFAAADDLDSRALWLRPASGEALVGLGSALALSGSPERVAAEWRALVAGADVDSESRPGPRLLGGFCFDPLASGSQLWDGFGVGRLVLPECLFSVQHGTTFLTTNRFAGGSPLVSRVNEAVEAPPHLGLSPSDWQALVGEVASTIARGDTGLRKVVLARGQQVQMRVTLEAALRRLVADYSTCTIFACATRDACFLGATPERLVALHDGTATTMALAGTAPRGETPAEDLAIGQRLLRDPKERTEHVVVADAVREALAPLATRVVADPEPRLHTLPNVQHLITPICAEMKEGRGALDLVNALHPTPAVGGYPREPALKLIREREVLDRGWYAAPIGWVDGRGEGEFVVGLRSALVRGETATLFAGCGIVADSDPPTELAEWGWKLKPMATALGAR
jgi:isochorismate synthase